MNKLPFVHDNCWLLFGPRNLFIAAHTTPANGVGVTSGTSEPTPRLYLWLFCKEGYEFFLPWTGYSANGSPVFMPTTVAMIDRSKHFSYLFLRKPFCAGGWLFWPRQNSTDQHRAHDGYIWNKTEIILKQKNCYRFTSDVVSCEIEQKQNTETILKRFNIVSELF